MIEMGKKYQTRDGRAVRILCVDGPGTQPVIGIVEGEDGPDTWTTDGEWSEQLDTWDLVPVPEKYEGWMVMVGGTHPPCACTLFCTKEGAEHHVASLGYGSVVRVTWEE